MPVPEQDEYTVTGAMEWEEYRIALPAGAKYFAIRCVSDGCMAFMLDNITYTPAGAIVDEISLMGYNVYRDGVKLNAAPVGESSFDDADVENGNTYTYKVTAVYDKGESVYSNEVTVKYEGASVDDVVSERVSIAAGEGCVIVSGAAGEHVRVFSASGVCVFDGVVRGTVRISLADGVYVVSAGERKAKVYVR